MTGFSRKLHPKQHNNSTFSDILNLIGAMIKPALENTLSDAADVAGIVNTACATPPNLESFQRLFVHSFLKRVSSSRRCSFILSLRSNPESKNPEDRQRLLGAHQSYLHIPVMIFQVLYEWEVLYGQNFSTVPIISADWPTCLSSALRWPTLFVNDSALAANFYMLV